MRTTIHVAIAFLLVLSGCGKSIDPEAVIRVRLKQGAALPDQYTLMAQQEVLRSNRYLGHVSKALGLEKMWGVKEDDTIRNLREALVVNPDEQTGQLVLQMRRLDKDLSGRVLNALCDFYAANQHLFRSNGGPPTELQVEVIQRAQ